MGPWTRFVDNVSGKLAFCPPTPSTYEVKQHSDGQRELYIQPLDPMYRKVLQCTVSIIKTKPRTGGGGGQDIITAFVPYKSRAGAAAKLTLLFSHGNAVDLGQMLPVFRDMASTLKINVMAYDYSGYGCSTGEASATNTLADIEAVYDHLVQSKGVRPRDIVLYGQSVGSGPTGYLASQKAELGGVVFHSPMLSGFRVLSPHVRWWPTWADIYPNHLWVPRIKSPVTVLHGDQDEVIDVCHGKKLHAMAPNKWEPLWAEGFNHQNLEACPRYLDHITRFLQYVDCNAQTTSRASCSSCIATPSPGRVT